jgi:hypothetical protein
MPRSYHGYDNWIPWSGDTPMQCGLLRSKRPASSYVRVLHACSRARRNENMIRMGAAGFIFVCLFSTRISPRISTNLINKCTALSNQSFESYCLQMGLYCSDHKHVRVCFRRWILLHITMYIMARVDGAWTQRFYLNDIDLDYGTTSIFFSVWSSIHWFYFWNEANRRSAKFYSTHR